MNMIFTGKSIITHVSFEDQSDEDSPELSIDVNLERRLNKQGIQNVKYDLYMGMYDDNIKEQVSKWIKQQEK